MGGMARNTHPDTASRCQGHTTLRGTLVSSRQEERRHSATQASIPTHTSPGQHLAKRVLGPFTFRNCWRPQRALFMWVFAANINTIRLPY